MEPGYCGSRCILVVGDMDDSRLTALLLRNVEVFLREWARDRLRPRGSWNRERRKIIIWR